MAGMSDTAQKRDVLEALRSLLAHRTEDLGCYEFVLEAWIESAADEIERLRAARRWIPVEEQWPKHGSDVLVAYKAGQYVLLGVGEFDGTTVNDDGVTVPYFKGIGGFEVTHWMPLPEPPEVK